jgi:hypothetical protein
MASSLLNFLVWDGSVNIAARRSSIRPIESKVKSRAWSCLTSSFANIAMWKRVTSDCIPRKSLFGIAPETTAALEKGRLFGDEQKATGIIDQWLTIGELAKLFGLSEESIKRLAKKNGFPLRRLTPYATPGVLESELFRWLKAQPPVGRAVRASRVSRSRNISVPKHRR